MFWTSCFYILIALISLFIISRVKTSKAQRRVYTRSELLEKNKVSEPPNDWKSYQSPITKLIEIPSPKVASIPIVSSISKPKEETLESFILKEIENSVKELDKKRVPFSNLDSNVLRNRLNPSVQEFLPKARLNPHAQDFYPY